MALIAHLAADAANFSFHPADGGAASVIETPWHRAVVLIEDAAGNLVRSVEAFADGRLDVRGEGEAPHGAAGTASSADTPQDQVDDAPNAEGTTATEQGFAGFSQHADEDAAQAKP